MGPVHVIGATGRSGAALLHALGDAAVPVIRNPARWQPRRGAAPRIADLTDAASLGAALSDAATIVSTAHARHTAALLAAAPPRATLILLGSTRKFTRWPDAHGNGVLAGEAAFLRSGRRGVMLHPTMIYGAQGESNVQRLAALMRRLPVLPLPQGGRALVQPIHQDDVVRAVLAAIRCAWDGPHSLVIAGPQPVPYAGFVRAVAAAAGLRPPYIVPFPPAPLRALAALAAWLPLLPAVQPDEVRRLTEDKAFDIEPMRRLLGMEPIPLQAGLARTFAALHLDAPA
jgi:nucleoside-diphosphate-sugar epimerase